jgi:hypothetical protein
MYKPQSANNQCDPPSPLCGLEQALLDAVEPDGNHQTLDGDNKNQDGDHQSADISKEASPLCWLEQPLLGTIEPNGNLQPHMANLTNPRWQSPICIFPRTALLA